MMAESTRRNSVLIVGAGPAGLVVAHELAIAGVEPILIDSREARWDHPRGFNLNARTLDLLSFRKLDEPFIAEGFQLPQAAFSGLPVTVGFEGVLTDHPYSLGLGQNRIEQILEERLGGLGVHVRWSHRLESFAQHKESITARVRTTQGVQDFSTEYIVGCDGSRSAVRKKAGIGFPGTAAHRYTLLGDVAIPEDLPFGVTSGPNGSVFVIPRPDYARIIVADPDPSAETTAPVTLARLEAAIESALDRTVKLTEPRWLTRFGDAARQAERYIDNCVLLAGDAAHIFPPAGAIGVNVAIDDAFNLGWKLAATIRHEANPGVLASYESERMAAGADIIRNARAQVALQTMDDTTMLTIKDLFTRVVSRPSGNRALAEVITGLSTRYSMPGYEDSKADPRIGTLGTGMTVLMG